MQNTIITGLEQISPEWLTKILTRSHALIQGNVTSFTSTTNTRELSTGCRLKLSYSANSYGPCPTRLFLKMVTTDMDDEFFGVSEVNYYVRDYVDADDAPIPRAYDAEYSEESGQYHILMDDLSETHVDAHDKTPTLDYGLALAEALAALHVHHWGKQRLEALNAPIHDAEAIMRFVDIARPGAGHIIAAVGDQLEAHWPDVILEIYDKHPQKLIDRTQNTAGFSLIHGDANWHNILVPKASTKPLYIIDRQPFDWSLTTWLAVYDLAYAMVLDWDSKLRREFEKPVLRHYYEQLIQRGVQNYSWEKLWDDYRLMVMMCTYVATEWCRGRFNPGTMHRWMPMLRQTMTACDDLMCLELL